MRSLLKAMQALACLLSSTITFAQSLSYERAIDSLYANLDMTSVTSGILYDRAFSVTRLHGYNSATDTVAAAYLEQAYFELYNAATNRSNFLSIEEFQYLQKLESFFNRVPVTVIDYTMHYLRPDAVQQNLVAYTNRQK